MTDSNDPNHRVSRRRFLTRSALAAAAVPIASSGLAAQTQDHHHQAMGTEPFWGEHQGGVTTPPQRHTYFMAFTLTTAKRDDVIALLRAWTQAAAEMTQRPAGPAGAAAPDQIPEDSGDTLGLPAHRLTVTFGFGPTLFEKDGVDRYGLASLRPEALVDLPRFPGDQLVPERTGGDLSVQASADDPMVAEHAIRRMVRLAYGTANIAWAQTGFLGGFKLGETPRNQMGFKDGTMNVQTTDRAALKEFVWVAEEGPAWLRGGSYMVVRPIRIALEHWDRMKLSFQEQTVGRYKISGAPIGQKHEFDPPDLDAEDKEGNPVIAENSHVRLAAPASNDGVQILRRGYSYDNGVMHLAERWPPWRQATTFDAGLLFQCYQRDPRTGFIKLFAKMSAFDMLNQFTTHVGSGLFACPPGARPGEYVGQGLFPEA
jgi:deferrochelatase/peroxidase EfeB